MVGVMTKAKNCSRNVSLSVAGEPEQKFPRVRKPERSISRDDWAPRIVSRNLRLGWSLAAPCKYHNNIVESSTMFGTKSS
jgi:hypothetical protein